MKSLLMIIALLVTSLTLQSPVAAQDVDCDAINGYFDEVDAAMAEEIHALVTLPGWAEDARGALLILAQGSPDEEASIDIDPIVELLTVPRDVLSAMSEDAIPDDALALHESALGFWTEFPEWSTTNIEGDPEAIEATNATMGAFSNDNLEALDVIDAACPGLIDDWLDNLGHLNSLFDQLDVEDGDPEMLANASIEDFEGIGVEFLTMPAGMAFLFQPLPPVATPDATPET